MTAPLEAAPSRRRPRPPARAWLWLAVPAVLFGLAVAAEVDSGPPKVTLDTPLTVRESGPAPEFALENVHKGSPEVILASYRGTPVVVNLWASWCAPCRQEMPAFQRVSEQLGGQVAFVGVNHKDTRQSALHRLQETGVRYPSGFDPDGRVAAAYRAVGMPTTLFISAGGELLERRNGELGEAELVEVLERLFGTRPVG